MKAHEAFVLTNYTISQLFNLPIIIFSLFIPKVDKYNQAYPSFLPKGG